MGRSNYNTPKNQEQDKLLRLFYISYRALASF